MHHSDDHSEFFLKKIFFSKNCHIVFTILSHTSRSHIAIHPDPNLIQLIQLDKEHISLNISYENYDNPIQNSPEILLEILFQQNSFSKIVP